jgi:DNA (cytosine-5)-methyltransferase 1
VLTDLEAEGYTARTFVIPACAVDAHHRRDRVWIIAHANSESESDGTKHEQRMVENSKCEPRRDSESITRRQDNKSKWSEDTDTVAGSSENVAYTNGSQCQRNSSAIRTSAKYSDIGGPSWWKPEPDVGRVANGVPRRSHRLKQLVVEQIGKAIWSIEHELV